MKDVIDICAKSSSAHQRAGAEALAAGLARHGIRARILDSTRERPESDIVACWGWKHGKRLRARGRQVLVMELAYMRDRYHWISLGWNGLNGRARFPQVDDGGARWRKYFEELMRPWRPHGTGRYTLIVGQVPVDQAVAGIDIAAWANDVARELDRAGMEPRWRPHPKAQHVSCIAPQAGGDLAQALEGAELVVTWNSNTGVDAVLAGVPTVTWDEGAMAWPVSAHRSFHQVRPDRTAWAHRIAYTQWLPEEIAAGEAWAHLKDCLD